MELFRNTNYDFLGKKWPFIIASLILTAAGLISLAIKGGPRYGIEFKGGMLITVRFQGTPPVNRLRSALDKALTIAPTVQSFESSDNEVSIGTAGADDQTLAKNHQIVLDTLRNTFGQPNSGKLDLNNSGVDGLVNRLREPLQNAGAGLSDDQLKALAQGIMDFRNTPPRSGLIANLDDLKQVPGVTPQILNIIQQQCYLGSLFGAARHRNGGAAGGRGFAAAGNLRHPACAGRNAGVYLVPVRMDLRVGRGDRGVSRHHHHHRDVLSFQQGDGPDRDCGAC